MATGRNPFQRESAPAAIVAILNEAPQLPDELPIELRGIIYHALSKDAATRYASCGEILADLEAFESPGSVAQATRATRTSASLRASIERASVQMLGHEARPGRKKLWLILAAAVIVVAGVLAAIPSVRNLIFGRPEQHVAVLPFENVGNDRRTKPYPKA